MPLTIKVVGPAPGASTILKGLPDGLTLAELQAKISEATGVAPASQTLKAGFPPKEVATADGAAAVTSLGITSGSAITVSQAGGGGNGAASGSGSSNGATSGNSGRLGGGGPSTSSTSSSNPRVQQLVDMGFSTGVAAKALEMAHNDVGAALELCISGVVTEESLASLGPAAASSSSASSSSASMAAPPALANGRVMVRRVIDADNSCLFNAIGYLMEKDRKVGAKLRKIIADTVRNRPDQYTEAVLGQAPGAYSSWIQDPKTWGGEIELFILSQYYGAEIVAIEIKSQHSYVYGEGKNYQRRIYVLYDGVHYDAIAGAAGTTSAPESMDQRQFPAGDEESRRQALALAAQLKQSHQFVDLAGFTLRCMVCNKGLTGEKEAREHAMATRHQNFAQYSG